MTTPTVRVTGEITVERCMVTVVRRGGWSWGGDPRVLVQRVLDTVPDVLSERFAEHLTGDGPDVEITEPVRLTVRLGSGLGASSPVVVSSPPVEVISVPSDPEPMSFEESFAEEDAWSPLSVADFFASLAERDELDPLLALLPVTSVQIYLGALLATASFDDVSTVVSALVRRLAPEQVVTRETAVRLTQSLPETALPEPARVEVRAGEVDVRSVLPFLLAGPLARIGYLDAIGPALAGAELGTETPLFAAALAYKVLGVPGRGWRRTPEDNVAAAVFAGLDSVPDLVPFARLVRPALPVLDSVLALSLCRGHDAGQPLLLTAVGNELLVVDSQGMFPIAWGAVPDVLPHWQACGRPPILVCSSPLPAGCLRDLASAGVAFLTDVRPLRGDPVSRLPWRSPLWVHGSVNTRVATEFASHSTRLADLVSDLAVSRRAVPLASDGDLDRSVTLAAGLGLGTLAWMLWRDRETPDPVLALRRFADLSATVRFTRDAVRVRVPLGRRHADLLRAGLLADVPDVVWLGGRTLTFSGG
jgi:hypothetical protein